MIRWLKSLVAWRYEFHSRGWEYERNHITGQRRARRDRAIRHDPRDLDVAWLRAGGANPKVEGLDLSRWVFDQQKAMFDA